jgi:arylformamidase
MVAFMTFPSWRSYEPTSLDMQYSPSLSAKDFAGNLNRYAGETAAAKRSFAMQGQFDIPYGHGARQTLDVFPTMNGDGPSPIHVFIHGGFWQESSKEYAGFPAPAFADAGSAFVAVNYTLAPAAKLAEIVAEIGQAYDWVRRNAARFGGDPKRITVSGHSAGAYLAASLIAAYPGVERVEDRDGPVALLLISGVFDLAPIQACYVNDALGLSVDEAAHLNLVAASPRRDVPVCVAVGGEETSEFRRQSVALFDAWRPHLSEMSFVQIDGRDHFDILFDLSERAGTLCRRAQSLLKDN